MMADEAPLFSVIVPTYQRTRELARCLQAIEALSFPRDRFEVVVVDDGSAHPPRDVVAGFAERLPVALVTASHAGPAAARNAGAHIARGSHLVFTDDDCALAPDYLTVLAEHVERHPAWAIGGRTVNAFPGDLFSSASQDLIDYLYEYYNARSGEARFFASNNLVVPRALFHEIGGFDTTFPLAGAEDRDFCDRWREHGLELVYVAEAVVQHAHRLTVRGFWRQHLTYGRGAFYLHRARARRGRAVPRLEPTSFYLQLIRHPLRAQRGWRGAVMSALLVVSQAAYGSGYYWERARHGQLLRATMPSPVERPVADQLPHGQPASRHQSARRPRDARVAESDPR